MLLGAFPCRAAHSRECCQWFEKMSFKCSGSSPRDSRHLSCWSVLKQAAEPDLWPHYHTELFVPEGIKPQVFVDTNKREFSKLNVITILSLLPPPTLNERKLCITRLPGQINIKSVKTMTSPKAWCEAAFNFFRLDLEMNSHCCYISRNKNAGVQRQNEPQEKWKLEEGKTRQTLTQIMSHHEVMWTHTFSGGIYQIKSLNLDYYTFVSVAENLTTWTYCSPKSNRRHLRTWNNTMKIKPNFPVQLLLICLNFTVQQ